MNFKQYRDPEEILEGRSVHCYLLKARFTVVRFATCLPFTSSALQPGKALLNRNGRRF